MSADETHRPAAVGDAGDPGDVGDAAGDAGGAAARREELAAALQAVRERVDAACADAGREDRPALVVVTKYFPRSDVDHLAALGVTDIGENRAQEAAAKLEEGGGPPPGVRTHMVGQLQSKKAGAVARWADVVHSLDRGKLVGALARGAERAGRRLTVLLQVDLDDPEADAGAGGGAGGAASRGGAAPEDVPALADEVASLPGAPLTLGGVMAVAPRQGDADPAFARLAEISARLRRDHPDATWISAGMSGDLEEAVRHGATHLRVGTAILGSRQSHR